LAAGRGDGESASRVLASFPDEPEQGKQLICPFLSKKSHYLGKCQPVLPRNSARDPSFPLAPLIKAAAFDEISGRRREEERS
jgi:hypothetical protein